MNIYKPIVAAIVASLLFAVYLADRQRDVRDTREELRAARLIPFDFPAAEYVELRNEHGNFVLERRDEDEWWLTKPREMRADEDRVRVLVDSFHAHKRTTTFEPTEGLAAYGLSDPSPTVTIRGDDGTGDVERTVYLGAETNHRVYAQMAGEEEIFTVGNWIRNQSLADLGLLRDKRLLRFEPAEVTSVHLERRGDSLTFVPDSNGRWMIKELDQPAQQGHLERSLADLASAFAVRIIDNPTSTPAQLGLEDPLLEIVLDTQSGTERLTVGSGNAEDEFLVRSNQLESVAVVRGGFLGNWLIPETQWGTKRFVWIPADDIVRIETNSLNTSMAVVRTSDGTWEFEDAPGVPVHPRKMEIFLEALLDFRGLALKDRDLDEDAESSRYGIREESYTVWVSDAEGRLQGFRLGLSVAQSEMGYCKRLQDGTIWTIDEGRVGFVRAFRSDLQDKRIETGWAEEASRMVYSNTSEGADKGYIMESRGEVWRLGKPGQTAALIPSRLVDNFLVAIEDLEWDSIAVVEETPESKFRMDFQNEAGETVYFLEALETTREEITLNTPKGIFEVRMGQWLMAYRQFQIMIGSAETEQSGEGVHIPERGSALPRVHEN